MKPSGTNYIVLDDGGRAWIEGANVKVIEVAKENAGCGMTAEEIHEQHPHLPLAKIYAALSYYHDHKDEFDAEMERLRVMVEELRAQNQDTAILREKLRAM